MDFSAQASTAAMLHRNISPARYASYRASTTSDADAARLYRWNLEMAGAFHESLSIVEIVLRNAIDRELRVWNTTRRDRTGQDHSSEWVKDPARPLYGLLNNPKFRTYDSAHTRAVQSAQARSANHPRHGHPVSHDDIVANITFGTWVKLLPKGDPNNPGQNATGPTDGLWQNALKNAFPNKPHGPVIHYWTTRLHQLRNRVAHAEPLMSVDFMSYHRTATRLLRAIDTEAGQWHSGISKVPHLASARPC